MQNKLDEHVAAYQGENIYDFDNEILLKWYPHRVLMNNDGSGSMLELGLGHGYTTEIFSERFNRYVVLDGSRAVIENFRKRFPDCSAEIIETFFEVFQSDEEFDVIVMGFILEHVDDPIQILKHYRNFLVPNGRMYLTVPNAEVLNRRLGHLAGMLPDMQEMSEHDRLLGHQRYYTVDTFRQDIEKAGYSIERMEGLYLKPLTTAQMLSLNLGAPVIEALCKAGIDYPELCCGMLAEVTLSNS